MFNLTTINGRGILRISLLLFVVPMALLLVAAQIWPTIDTFLKNNWLIVLRDLIASIGFILTIWGLVATFDQAQNARIQAQEAKASAEQARDASQEATEKIRQSVARIDTVGVLESAIALIDRVYEYQSRNEWDRVPEFYKDLRNLLAIVQGEASALESTDKAYVLAAVSELKSIELSIQKRRQFDMVIDNMPEMNQVITNHGGQFIRMKTDLGRRE